MLLNAKRGVSVIKGISGSSGVPMNSRVRQGDPAPLLWGALKARRPYDEGMHQTRRPFYGAPGKDGALMLRGCGKPGGPCWRIPDTRKPSPGS